MYNQYKDTDEAAFPIKLGIRSEETYQNRDLNELVQNKNGKYFRGIWPEIGMGDNGRYIGQIFTADNAELDDHNITTPGVDTRVVIYVDPENPPRPDPNHLRCSKGVVVKGIFQHGASFCCFRLRFLTEHSQVHYSLCCWNTRSALTTSFTTQLKSGRWWSLNSSSGSNRQTSCPLWTSRPSSLDAHIQRQTHASLPRVSPARSFRYSRILRGTAARSGRRPRLS